MRFLNKYNENIFKDTNHFTYLCLLITYSNMATANKSITAKGTPVARPRVSFDLSVKFKEHFSMDHLLADQASRILLSVIL